MLRIAGNWSPQFIFAARRLVAQGATGVSKMNAAIERGETRRRGSGFNQ
jgi:hypothetical protein